MRERGKGALAGRVVGRGALAARRPLDVALVPDAPERAALARDLGLEVLRKLRLTGRLLPEGRDDWRLEAELQATVVQPCVVTLAPVTTRIAARVLRRFLSQPPAASAGKSEMPRDDALEPLGETIDLGAVMAEALALEIPAWPRAEGVQIGTLRHGPSGSDGSDDPASRPLAGLAQLRRRTKK